MHAEIMWCAGQCRRGRSCWSWIQPHARHHFKKKKNARAKSLRGERRGGGQVVVVGGRGLCWGIHGVEPSSREPGMLGQNGVKNRDTNIRFFGIHGVSTGSRLVFVHWTIPESIDVCFLVVLGGGGGGVLLGRGGGRCWRQTDKKKGQIEFKQNRNSSNNQLRAKLD